MSLDNYVDIKLFDEDSNGLYEWQLDDTGDIVCENSFESQILYATFGEQRAEPSQVIVSEYRRGWIGNEFESYENGSKLWLYSQSRLTRSTLNGMRSALQNAYAYFISDGLLANVEVNVTSNGEGAKVEALFYRFDSKVDRRYYDLWQNTGA